MSQKIIKQSKPEVTPKNKFYSFVEINVFYKSDFHLYKQNLLRMKSILYLINYLEIWKNLHFHAAFQEKQFFHRFEDLKLLCFP